MADRESLERLASEFTSRAEETKNLAVRWSPDLGYSFIDALKGSADPGAVQELKTLAADTRALLQQDGIRETWVVLLDAIRAFDQTVKVTSHSRLSLPRRNILPALAGAASRQSVGAIPGRIRFEPTPAHLQAPQFRRFPFCRFELEFPFRRYQDIDLLPVEGEEIMYVARFVTVQIGAPEPASHQLFRVIARYCLHRKSEMRQVTTAGAAAPPAATPPAATPPPAPAEPPDRAGHKGDASQAPPPPEPDTGARTGPKPDPQRTARIVAVVERVAPDGNWKSKLDEILDALDDEKAEDGEQILISPAWRHRKWKHWSDCDDRRLAVKVIEYQLKCARKLRER
jgi:hypothetical protein